MVEIETADTLPENVNNYETIYSYLEEKWFKRVANSLEENRESPAVKVIKTVNQVMDDFICKDGTSKEQFKSGLFEQICKLKPSLDLKCSNVRIFGDMFIFPYFAHSKLLFFAVQL